MTDTALSETYVREHLAALMRQLAPDAPDEDLDRPASLIDDYGYHSLALLELAFAVEDDFDLPPLDEETGRQLQTDHDVVEYVVGELRDLGSIA